MVNTTYNSTEEMINQLQELKGKTKLKFYETISNYSDNVNIRFEEDLFAKNAQGMSKICHELLMLMKVLQTKPQVNNLNINYYDLYYTVNKNRDENESVDNQYENDYISLNHVFIPNHYDGIKGREK